MRPPALLFVAVTLPLTLTFSTDQPPELWVLPASAPTFDWPLMLALVNRTLLTAPPRLPNSPTSLVPDWVSASMVCPRPLNRPVKAAVLFPIGVKFDRLEALMSLPST